MAAIEVSDLTKRYGEVVGVDSLSFTVEEGEILGFLGPNGAGKTTAIRTLLGIQTPTSGTATVLGADVRAERDLLEAKRRLGYVPASPTFDAGSTGAEILDLHGDVKGDSRRAELLDRFDVPLDRPVRDYSTGNVQKLAVVQAFMHDPALVIMDEPTSGLDPLVQREFNDFVQAERSRGVTVFFSSHVLSEVRRLCDRVAVLRDGELVATESVSELLTRSGKVVRLRVVGEPPASTFDFDGVHDIDRRVVRGAGTDADQVETDVSFTFTGDVNDLTAAVADLELREFDVEEAPLDEVFMRFYGGGDA
ncbi:ABC transporter ATP-binding protein [Halobaculum sp. P14]|uniref:ABC transporter ATP-binding protein n=1 Tax=Halobaculum sp. P14 TaxID=3421638 RepID=UPI003EBA0097